MKAVKKETIDDILGKLDPLEMAIMILGGTAAMNGIVPPLTQLLRTMGGIGASNLGGSGTGVTVGYGIPWMSGLSILDAMSKEPGASEAQAKVISEGDVRLGLFCSGAVEAMIMYNFVKNPKAVESLLAMPGQILHGIGEIVPG